MQGSLNSIENVIKWIDNHECYIWTLYSIDRKTILARNEVTSEPSRSKEWIKNELENRSSYGGAFALYINDKKGNGGQWSDIVLPQLSSQNQMAGINGGGANIMPYGVGSIDEYINKELERREMKRRLEELEAGVGQSEKFWQRQVDKITEHPNFDPNTATLAIGGILSRAVNIFEIAMGINGAKQTATPPPSVTQTPINGVPPVHTEPPPPTEGVGTTDEDMDTYDGDALADVCDDLKEIYPDKKPEEVLLILKNLIKNDPMTAQTVRAMAKF